MGQFFGRAGSCVDSPASVTFARDVMEVRCERCRAKDVFADDQVGEHGPTVRCSNCGHLFKVKKKALVVTLPMGPGDSAEGAVSAADAHRAAAVQAAAQTVFAEAERREWTLRQPSGQTYTYKDMSTLHRWIVERKAHREDEICRPGEPWRRLGAIPELQSFFAVVEAAERAAQAPAAQPTIVQFPASAPPAPADDAFAEGIDAFFEKRQAGQYGALGVVFMGLWITKQDQDSIAHVLRDMPLKTFGCVGGGLVVLRDNIMHIFGVKLCGKLRGPNQV